MRKKAGCSVARTLGRNIRLLRQVRGWSQEDLAERVGDTAATVCRWESGKRIPTLATLERIGGAFQMPVPSLLSPVRLVVDGVAERTAAQ
jgi:transcriptional regulator with XRE-family HTH domain